MPVAADRARYLAGGGRGEVLLIGGRSGVGKSSVGFEVSELLKDEGVAHVLVDGDNLDACYPKPSGDPHGTALTQADLVAIWSNYAAAGQRRMVYVNTASVTETPMIVRALGGDARVVAVLLSASDQVAATRLASREIGSALQIDIQRSAAAARWLQEQADRSVVRLATDGRTVGQVPADVVNFTGWTRWPPVAGDDVAAMHHHRGVALHTMGVEPVQRGGDRMEVNHRGNAER